MDNENNENSSLLDDDEPTLDLDLNVLQQLAESFWKKIKATNKLHLVLTGFFRLLENLC